MNHNADIFCFDLETGGFSCLKNPICEIGVVVLDYALNEIDSYGAVIAPHDKGGWGDEAYPYGIYDKKALEVNKLSMRQIEEGENSETVISCLRQMMIESKKRTKKKPILAGHNIRRFDIPYLKNFFSRHKLDLESYVEADFEIDTMWWARVRHEELDNYKLGTCCSSEGIEMINAHTALGDVKPNAELVKKYLLSLRGSGQGIVKEKRFRTEFQF